MLINNNTGIYFPKKNLSFNGTSSALKTLVAVTEKKPDIPEKKSFDYKKASVFAGVFLAAVGSLVYFVKKHKKIKINSEIGQTINDLKNPTSVMPEKESLQMKQEEFTKIKEELASQIAEIRKSNEQMSIKIEEIKKAKEENLNFLSEKFAKGIMCPKKEIIKELLPSILDRQKILMPEFSDEILEKYLQQINKDNYKFIKEEGLDILTDNMEKILEITETHSNAAKILHTLSPENKEFLPFLIKDPDAYKLENVRDITRCLFTLNGKDKDFITKEIMPLIKDNSDILRLTDTHEIATVLNNITKENKSILIDCIKEKKSILQALGLE